MWESVERLRFGVEDEVEVDGGESERMLEDSYPPITR